MWIPNSTYRPLQQGRAAASRCYRPFLAKPHGSLPCILGNINVPSEVNCTCSIDEQVLYGRKSNRRVQEKRAIIPTSMKRFPNTKSLKNSLLRRIWWKRVQTLRVSSINNTLWKGSAKHDDLKGKLEHPIRDCSSAEQTGKRPLKAHFLHFQPWCTARISCYGEIVDSYERPISTEIWYPLERLRLSVWKKMSSVRTALAIRLKKKCHQFERLGVSVGNKLSSVRTARAFRSKKLSSIQWTHRLPRKIILIYWLYKRTVIRKNATPTRPQLTTLAKFSETNSGVETGE